MNAEFIMFSSSKRCKLQYNDLVYYNEIIYEVKEVTIHTYKLSSFENENAICINVHHDDSSLKIIFKDVQSKIRKAHIFQKRYNREVLALEPYYNFKLLSLEFLIEYTIRQRLFSIKSINQLPFIIKNKKNLSLDLYNIIENPMDFILPEYTIFSYKKAFEICKEFHIQLDFNIHVEKWSYDLTNTTRSFYIPFNYFIEQFKEFCSLHEKKYEDSIDIMNQYFIHKKINGKNYRTTKYLMDLEDALTNQLIDCFYEKQYTISRESIQEHISAFEKQEEIRLNEKQLEAIYGAITNKLYIINGYPGTGKSTIVKCILYVFSQLSHSSHDTTIPKSKQISILAPTGLAYLGLSTKCKTDKLILFDEELSGTCHRILYCKFDKNTTKRDVIIVDEFSMIDIYILRDIVEYCQIFQCRLLIIGDENQLPSIGPGCCLLNIARSNIFGQTKLDEIKRQDGILMNNIKRMTSEILCKSHMTDETMKILSIREFTNTKDKSLNESMIRELFLRERFTMDDTKVLTYFKDEKYKCNTNNLNNIFQNFFNMRGMLISNPKKSFATTTFRVGDIIIRTENDYNNDNFRANGECASILSYYKEKVQILYKGDDASVFISLHILYDEFALAYALTVHKSQGSQYENVVIFIDENQYSWNKTALYTAISRAQKRCILITNEKDFLSIQKKICEDKVSQFMIESSEYDI